MQNIWLILVGLAIGAVLAVYPARTVKMTAMPQMVAIFNGMGGATAALVSLVEFQHKADIGRGEIVSIVLGVIIGSISFAGSMIAFGKLQELISGRADLLPEPAPGQRRHRHRGDRPRGRRHRARADRHQLLPDRRPLRWPRWCSVF